MKREIDDLYGEALSLCDDGEVELASFLSAKQRQYQNTVEEQINNLSKFVKSIIDCQSLLDANRELLYLTIDLLEKWDYTLGNKLAAHRKKLQNLSFDNKHLRAVHKPRQGAQSYQRFFAVYFV